MTTISMPLGIAMGFKCKDRKPILDKNGLKVPKMYYLNLNNYRNWHYQVSNNLKRKYKEIVERKFEDIDFLSRIDPVELTFIMYRKDKRKVDRSNVLSVHEKFFCDALVELGYIKDDADKYISSSHYYSGGIEKENPRVDIIIKEC